MLCKALLKTENLCIRLECIKRFKDIIVEWSKTPDIVKLQPLIRIMLFKVHA